jgi:predicted NUDIX family NTP pyrophosphohydrolase
MFRRDRGDVEVLIAHPGGPFWARKDSGAWSVPKGLVEQGEDPEQAALREFTEETGFSVDSGDIFSLGSVTMRSGKEVMAWAAPGAVDPAQASSNLVTMEWPRGSGRVIDFPEVDRVAWVSVEQAARLLNPAQVPFLARLTKYLDHA